MFFRQRENHASCFDQIVLFFARTDIAPGVVIPPAEKPEGDSLSLDNDLVDFAVVVAQFAYFIFHRNVFPVEGKPAETGFLNRIFRKDQCAAQRAGQMAEPGYKNGFVQPVLECGNQRPVAGRGALKTDVLANVGLHGDFSQIIFAYGM